MIIIAETVLEDVLKGLLQEQVVFTLNNKTWRKGKLLLFQQSGFYLEFILETNTKRETFEVPIPFEVYRKEIGVYFDYTVNTFVQGRPELFKLVDNLEINKKSKFYDTKMLVRINR